MKRVNLLAVSLLAFGQVLSGSVSAAPVTMSGISVDFSFDDALLGLFGSASVSGNTLFFTPTSFDAQSAGGTGSGLDLTKQTINVRRVTAHNGFAFNSVNLAERGGSLLLSSGATVDVGGQLHVFDLVTSSSDRTGTILLTAPLTAAGLPTHRTAGVTVNVADWTTASTLNVTPENIFVASSVPGSLGFVEKEYAGLNVSVAPVPEAETWAMMAAGLGLVGFAAARRRAV